MSTHDPLPAPIGRFGACALSRCWAVAVGGVAMPGIAEARQAAWVVPAVVMAAGLVLAVCALTAVVLHGVLRRLRGTESQSSGTSQGLALYQTAFEHAAAGIAIVDMSGRTVRVNGRMMEILGYTADELLDIRLRSLVHRDDIDIAMHQRERLRSGEVSSLRLEHRYRHKCGHEVWASVTAALARDPQGAPLHFVIMLEDIGPRKAAEAQKELLTQAFSQASQPLLLADRDFRITYANPAFVAFLGHTLAELKGRHVDTLMPDTDVARRAQAAALAVLLEQGSFSGEMLRVASDGAAIPTMVTVGPLRDAAGEVTGWVASYLDLRPVRERESIVRKLALAVERSPAFVLITDLDGRIEYANAALMNASGYSLDELVGMDARALHRETATQPAGHGLDAAMSQRRPWDGALQMRAKAGGTSTVAASVLPLVEADGSIHHWVEVGEDVTERLRSDAELGRYRQHLEELVDQRTAALGAACRQLAEQRALLHTVTASLPGAVYYWDAELRCRFANGADLAQRGETMDSLLGRRLRDIVPEPHASHYEPLLREALAGARLAPATIAKPDGRQTQVTMVPDLRDGIGVGVTVVVNDVTALKNAEAQLRQMNLALVERAAQADAATQAKSAFLANMSHEIRTPMNAVMGLTHLLRRDCTDALQARRIDKVADAARHLLNIINDVLDFSRIESGKLELEDVDFDLDAVLTRSTGLFAEAAADKGLMLTTDACGLPKRVRGDSTRLSQALVNLLGNAVKFTERGAVTLHAASVESDAHSVLMRFEVRDTGIGIAADRITRLFAAFEQADSSTTRKFGGSGLGLSITRRLAEMMGGQAGAVSTPGEGSTFWFTARLKIAHGAVAEESGLAAGVRVEEVLRARHAGKRILLAEDNPVNQEVGRALLQIAGLKVDVAEDGDRALKMARHGNHALILMDMQMPVMDGLQSARAIREVAGMQSLPIIAMTANAFGEDRAACVAAGMNDYLSKPVDPKLLYEMLLRWLPA